LLRRFRVFLDYERSRLVLEKSGSFDEPFASDASGLTLVAEGAELDRVRVAGVVRGSPGEEAGIRAGDRILTVDGKPVADLPELNRKFLEVGRRWALHLDRDGRGVEVRLRSRPVI
jgi:C-terminal processing protease CtpA/Prc